MLLILLTVPLGPWIAAAAGLGAAPYWVEPEFRVNDAVSAWDPVTEELLLFRQPAEGEPVQVWAFRRDVSPQWQPLQIVGPSPTFLVAGMSITFDPAAHRLIAVAPSRWRGASETEVWSLALAGPLAWSRLQISGLAPDSRMKPSIVALPEPSRLLLFGGMTTLPPLGVPGGPEYRNDTWLLDLGADPSWTELRPDGDLPPKRRNGALAADPQSQQAVLLGGDFLIAPTTNMAWIFSLKDTAWSPLVATGNAPTNTRPHALLFDSKRGAFIAVTSGAERVRTDLLRLGASPRWDGLSLDNAPVARMSGIAHLDQLHDRLVLAGGLGPNAESLDQVWACDLNGTRAWEDWTPGSTRPSARSFHAGVWVESMGTVAYLGGAITRSIPGSFSRIPDSDLWLLSPDGTQPLWSAPQLGDLPEFDRSSPGLVWDSKRNRLVALGEPEPSGSKCWPCNRVWEYEPGAGTGWQAIDVDGPAPEIYLLGSFYDRRRDRLLAVSRSLQGDIEVWALLLGTPPRWVRLEPGIQSPPPRSEPGLALDEAGDRIVMYGGFAAAGGVRLADTWTFDLDGAEGWSEIATAGVPPPQPESACVDLLRRRLLVFSSLPLSPADLGVFELDLGGVPIWRELEITGTSPGRLSYFPAVYDPRGDRVIIFGGSHPTGDSPASTDGLWYLDLGSPLVNVELTLNGGAQNHLGRPTGRARLHVTILSSPTFDARSVDAASVRFDGAPVLDQPGVGLRMARERDVNGDGLPDLSLVFRSDQTSDETHSAVATLTGRTFDGRRVEGSMRLADSRPYPAAAGPVDAGSVGLSMSVGPNPTIGVVRVRFHLTRDAPARIEVFDLGGRRIHSTELVGGLALQGETVIRMPDGTPNGLYWFRLMQAGRAVLARIVVSR